MSYENIDSLPTYKHPDAHQPLPAGIENAFRREHQKGEFEDE